MLSIAHPSERTKVTLRALTLHRNAAPAANRHNVRQRSRYH
ncbi:MAG TPA: hypothetical protein V6D19_07610 [Stenomitos sp.]